MISSVVRTVLVYLAVVVAMRLMGKRQLGELQPAELVTTLLISNVASICIDEPDLPLSASLVPIFSDNRFGNPELHAGLVLPALCAAAVGKAGDHHPQRRNSAGRAGPAAHYRGRSGGGTARQGHILPAGGLLGRGGAERQYYHRSDARGR